MAAPFDRHHRNRQRQADPEAARHVDEFGIGAGVGGRHLRFQRHAADRAGAGADLADLRVHRAGVDGAFDHRLRFAGLEVLVGIAGELGLAAVAAEVIGGAVVLVAVLGGRRINGHAADGIDLASRGLFGALLRQILVGIGRELGFAAGRAEVIGLAAVLGLMLGGRGIDRHAADGVEDAGHGGVMRIVGVMVVVVMMVGGAHDGPCNGLYYIPVGGI